jgi:hypothetical protein
VAAKHKKHVNPAVKQAKAEAWLRTNPEASALTQLLHDARNNYKSSVSVETGAAKGVAAAANAAIPKVSSYYDAADQTRASAQSVVDQKLAPLSAVADDIRAASAREAGGAQRRLAETRASTLGEFQSRKVDAQAGAAFALQSARATRDSSVGKIQGQIQRVAKENGVATVTALASINKANAQAAADRRTQKRLERASTAGITGVDPATGQPTLAANTAAQTHKDKVAARKSAARKAAKAGRPTKHQSVVAQGKFEQGIALADSLKVGGYVVKNGKKKYVAPATQSEIVHILTGKLGDGVLARAAAQQSLHGGVGHKTRVRAKRRYGLHLKPPGKNAINRHDLQTTFTL